MQTPENILVARAQSGSDAAFAELARKHSSQIYKCSLRILHNREDAEDNLQNVLLQAFRNINSFQGKSQFSTWLVGIAVNEALMKLRKRRRDKFVPLQAASNFWSPRLSPEVQATRAVLSRRLPRPSQGASLGIQFATYPACSTLFLRPVRSIAGFARRHGQTHSLC